MNITRVFTASVELLFAAALVQRDILSPGPAETFAITFFNWVNFSLTKCLAQSRALVRHLCPIVQQVLETCGSQDRDHRRYLETSSLRAPEHFKSDLLQEKIKHILSQNSNSVSWAPKKYPIAWAPKFVLRYLSPGPSSGGFPLRGLHTLHALLGQLLLR